MSKTDKLLDKLKRGKLSQREVTSLLEKLGWQRTRQKGSHAAWSNGVETIILVEDGRENLLPYQVKNIRQALVRSKQLEDENEKKEKAE